MEEREKEQEWAEGEVDLWHISSRAHREVWSYESPKFAWNGPAFLTPTQSDLNMGHPKKGHVLDEASLATIAGKEELLLDSGFAGLGLLVATFPGTWRGPDYPNVKCKWHSERKLCSQQVTTCNPWGLIPSVFPSILWDSPVSFSDIQVKKTPLPLKLV